MVKLENALTLKILRMTYNLERMEYLSNTNENDTISILQIFSKVNKAQSSEHLKSENDILHASEMHM